MKSLIILTLALVSFSTFACFDTGENGLICTGDKVYMNTHFPEGATVTRTDLEFNKIEIRANHIDFSVQVPANQLDMTEGCLENTCVGDTVFKGNIFKYGARVVAINRARKLVIINYKSDLFALYTKALYIKSGCIDNICAGDTVYAKKSLEDGGTVIAVSSHQQKFLIRAKSNNSFVVISAKELRTSRE